MNFTKEQLDSIISLYQQEYGEVIDCKEAQRQATALISLVKLTYEPMTETDFDKYSNLAKSDDCDNILMTLDKT